MIINSFRVIITNSFSLKKLKEVLDSRCSILVKLMGNNANGKNEDDPEPANTEPGIKNLL